MLEAAGYPDNTNALNIVWGKLGGKKGPAKRTLRRWFDGTSNPPPDNLVNLYKKDFVSQLEIIKGKSATQLIEWLEAGEMEPREVVGLMKIAAELGQLLTGEPTSRSEIKGQVDVNDARERLAHLITRYASRVGAESDTEQRH